jgi:serine/threonine protein kinase
MKMHAITLDYTLDRTIGFGAFGEVKLGKHKKTNKLFAVKKMPLDKNDTEVLEAIKNEFLILKKCVFMISILILFIGPPTHN